MAANDVILCPRTALLMQSELEAEVVLALQTPEVAYVQLGEYENNGGLLCQLDVELFVVLGLPGDLNSGPALTRAPVRVFEQTSAVKVLILAQEVVIGDPKSRITGEGVVKLLLYLRGPLLGPVRPCALPVALLDLAPRIPKSKSAILHEATRAQGNAYLSLQRRVPSFSVLASMTT